MSEIDKNLLELTEVCSKILVISRKYSYLWDESDIWDKDKEKHLPLFSGFITSAGNFEVYVRRIGNTSQFVFDGTNFGYSNGFGLGAEEAALEIKNSYGRITPERLRKSFCESLEKPLGRYLANKSLIERLFFGDKK
ncbi:MAG: hypothetical protein Q8N63_01370 [Nanoarchaeota archaeon]|nr:hypothetical protein [Nanoarchaeota archaeon]